MHPAADSKLLHSCAESRFITGVPCAAEADPEPAADDGNRPQHVIQATVSADDLAVPVQRKPWTLALSGQLVRRSLTLPLRTGENIQDGDRPLNLDRGGVGVTDTLGGGTEIVAVRKVLFFDLLGHAANRRIGGTTLTHLP